MAVIATIGIVFLAMAVGATVAGVLIRKEAQQRFQELVLARARQILQQTEVRSATRQSLSIVAGFYDTLLGSRILSAQAFRRSLFLGLALIAMGCAIAGVMTRTALGFEKPPWNWTSADRITELAHGNECRAASEADPGPSCEESSSEAEIRRRLLWEHEAALLKRFNTPIWRATHAVVLAVLVVVLLLVFHGSSTAFTRKIIADALRTDSGVLIFSSLALNFMGGAFLAFVTNFVIAWSSVAPVLVVETIYYISTNFSMSDIGLLAVLGSILFAILASIAAFASEPWMRVVALVVLSPAWLALAFTALSSAVLVLFQKPVLHGLAFALDRLRSRRYGFLLLVAGYAFTAAGFFSLLLQFYEALLGLE